jgi:hypothetical protein
MSLLLLLISTPQWNWRKAPSRFCLEERGEGGERVEAGGEGAREEK